MCKCTGAQVDYAAAIACELLYLRLAPVFAHLDIAHRLSAHIMHVRVMFVRFPRVCSLLSWLMHRLRASQLREGEQVSHSRIKTP